MEAFIFKRSVDNKDSSWNKFLVGGRLIINLTERGKREELQFEYSLKFET